MKLEVTDSRAGATDDAVARYVERDREVDALARESQKRLAKGPAARAMKLPPLLDKMRREYLIPNGAFDQQPIFDRVHVYQLAERNFEKTYAGTRIVMPDTVREGLRSETSRGILIGAGALALDQLRSNGVDLGHIVRFTKMTPYMQPIDVVNGKMFTCLVMMSGHITSSETLEAERRSGEKVLDWDETASQHVWRSGKTKKTTGVPKAPWISDDQ